MKTLFLIIMFNVLIFASDNRDNTDYLFYRLNIQLDKEALKACEDDYSIGKVSESCINSYKIKKFKELEQKFKLQVDLLSESINK